MDALKVEMDKVSDTKENVGDNTAAAAGNEVVYFALLESRTNQRCRGRRGS